jgi:hypothetical protein
VANLVSHSTTTNKVVWGRTLTEVNLLSRILLRVSLPEPKAKSKKMRSKRKRKLRPRLRQNRGLKRKKKTLERLRRRTSVIHTYYRIVLLSLMIFRIRWMTQEFQPPLV